MSGDHRPKRGQTKSRAEWRRALREAPRETVPTEGKTECREERNPPTECATGVQRLGEVTIEAEFARERGTTLRGNFRNDARSKSPLAASDDPNARVGDSRRT